MARTKFSGISNSCYCCIEIMNIHHFQNYLLFLKIKMTVIIMMMIIIVTTI